MIDFVRVMLEQRRLFNQLEVTGAQLRAARQRAQSDPLFAATEYKVVLERMSADIHRVHREADVIMEELSAHA